MAKQSCKCKATECEECPEWIFTFADLVMLMMGFFVILWVLKPNAEPKKYDTKAIAAQQDQWLDTVGEIRGGFGWEPNPASNDPVDKIAIRKRNAGEGKGGKTDVAPRGAKGEEPDVKSIRQGKQAIIGTRVQFAAGSADLSDEGHRSLDEMVKLIQGHRQIFIVKGHASLDDRADALGAKPDAKQLSQDRMNLSLRRAQVVADYLVAHGVEPQVLRVQGCSTFEAVAQQAYSEDLNTQNRRVEVESSDNSVNERKDTAKTSNVLPPGLKTESAITPLDSIDHR